MRVALRHLGNGREAARRAEARLVAEWDRAAPLLRMEAHAQADPTRAVRAAILLYRHSERKGAELLRRMVRTPRLRQGEGGALLREAAREAVGASYYLRQAAATLTRLEQRPEAVRAVERFQAALECLAFLGDSLPPELLDRALVVRTVGGEDLELVRAVLAGDHGASLEHACLARVQAVEMALALPDSATSYRLLARALRHPSPAVKLTALHGLGLLGDSRAAPAVRRLAADPDSPLSADARRCLALLSSRTSEDVVLLRPSAPASASSDALLRPAYTAADDAAHELLRPSR